MTSTTTFTPLDDTDLVISEANRYDPNSYANQDKVLTYGEIDFTSILPVEFLSINKNNFVIRKADIIEVYHNPKNKWGMGPYPHNGRVIIISKTSDFNSKQKRELILVGDQAEGPILDWINAK